MRVVVQFAGLALAALMSFPLSAQVTLPDGTVAPPEIVRQAGDACTAGKARACILDGMAWADALGRAQDVDAAARAMRAACDAGEAIGCLKEGDIAALRHDKQQDLALAQARWTAARTTFAATCDKGNAVGCKLLGDMHANYTAMKDVPRAALLYAKACFEQGVGPACQAGHLLSVSNPVAQPDRAVAERFEAAIEPALNAECDKGKAGACANLAEWIAANRAGPGAQMIAELAERACNGASALGCERAGTMAARADRSAAGWDRKRAYLDNACSLSLSYCAGLGDHLRAAPQERSVETSDLFMADSRACAAAIEAACFAIYDYAGNLNAAELEQMVATFDNTCLVGARPGAETCVAAARNHKEHAARAPSGAAADLAAARKLYERALQLPEDEQYEPYAHDEARAYLASQG